jgi:hypothetical protein
VPVRVLRVAEAILGSLPLAARNRLGTSRRFGWAMEVCLVGRKDR